MGRLFVVAALLAGCAPEAFVKYDFTYAVGRVAHQTDPTAIELRHGEPDRPYVVLADLEVTMRQQTTFGELPTPANVDAELRDRAARLGAHAVVLVRYGSLGASFWTWHELQGRGRAIRYR
ncbi:MAG: hypothetical protein HYV09_40380 [Deltaproteobacteria bacterium]|nr:hypothetical protein [Deltaproteobacteria bacterium]